METNLKQVEPEYLTIVDGGLKDKADLHEKTAQHTNLVGFLRRRWQNAKDLKNEVEKEILQDLRQYRGEYSADELQKIKMIGGSQIYAMLTNIKVRTAHAWIMDVLEPSGEPIFSITPTPDPELKPIDMLALRNILMQEIEEHVAAGGPLVEEDIRERAEQLKKEFFDIAKEDAKMAAEKMTHKIEDRFDEGDFSEAMNQVAFDIAATKAGILHGPVFRKKSKLSWVQVGQDYQPMAEDKICMEFRRVSPLDIYPCAGTTSFQDGDFFHLQRMNLADLESMIGVPGYFEDEIRGVIKEYGRSGLQETTNAQYERSEIEQKHNQSHESDGRIDVLCFYGRVHGSDLIDYGFAAEDRSYEVQTMMVGRRVIMIDIRENSLLPRPYSKTSYERVPGSFWGEGVGHLMRDVQSMCNACMRALANNMGIASGPQIVYNDISRIPDSEEISSLFPFKIHQFKGDAASSTNRPPIDFFQPSSNAQELLGVYQHFAKMADDVTGIPAYAYGNARAGGAGDTASGLSMLLTQASKGIKQVIRGLDQGIIEPVVEYIYKYEMLFGEPDSKLDANVTAKGSASLLIKEQMSMRRAEFLNQTANPVDMQIIGIDGRAAVLREVAKALDMPVDSIVPSREEIKQQQQAQAQAEAMQLAMENGVPAEQIQQQMEVA